jgi:hypothetical protein
MLTRRLRRRISALFPIDLIDISIDVSRSYQDSLMPCGLEGAGRFGKLPQPNPWPSNVIAAQEGCAHNISYGQRFRVCPVPDHGRGSIDQKSIHGMGPARPSDSRRILRLAVERQGCAGLPGFRFRPGAGGGVCRRLLLARVPILSPAAEFQPGILGSEDRAQQKTRRAHIATPTHGSLDRSADLGARAEAHSQGGSGQDCEGVEGRLIRGFSGARGGPGRVGRFGCDTLRS